MKKILLIKVLGSVALITSLLGIFIAISGNLNLFGQQRTPIKPLIKTEKDGGGNNGNKPKYSFYNELKQRKTELDSNANANSQPAAQNNQRTPANDSRLYVVQVGAYSQKSDAEKTASKVSKLGYKSRVVKPRGMDLVQAGPFKGRALADSQEKKLKAASFPTLIKVYNQ